MDKFVYILKEINLLDSGERDFYVDVYTNAEDAANDLEDQIQERLQEYNARIEWRDGDNVKLIDDGGNIYLFEIELKAIKETRDN
ncbi:hypothetical protein ACXEO8_20030 [Cytobacillus firmus]